MKKMHDDQPDDELFDERRIAICAAIHDRSPSLASYYKSAIHLLSRPASPGEERIRISMICHAVRELMNALPWVMRTTSAPPIDPSSRELLKKMPSQGINLEGDEAMVAAPREAVAWLNQFVHAVTFETRRVRGNLAALLGDTPQEDHALVTPWNEARTWFVGWAHFEQENSERRTLPTDDDILDHLRLVEDVIEARTKAFFDALESIEDILAAANAKTDNWDRPASAYSTPSRGDVIAALSRLPTMQHRRVFFERLKNPLWVRPLMEFQAFDYPSEPEVDDKGYIRELYWPEAEYLTRMAPSVPGDVVDVLLRLPASRNSWVRRSTFEIARSIPIREAVRLRELVDAWNPDFGWRTDPTDLTKFAVALLGAGQTKFGHAFTNMLFAPRDSAQGTRKPITTLEEHWYIQELPGVVEALGDSALSVVAPWLVRWEELNGNFTEKIDATILARSDIGNRDGRYEDTEQVLVEAVRDIAVRDMAAYPKTVARKLLACKMTLLRKIVLYAAAQKLGATADVAPTLIEVGLALLSDPASQVPRCRIEFSDLYIALRRRDQPVEESLQAALDAWPLGSGEAIEEAVRDREVAGSDAEARAREEMQRWQQLLLATIGAEHLPQAAAGLLADLDMRLGAIQSPREPSFRLSSWTVPTSPTTGEEMAEMSPDELVTHLERWRSGDAWAAPTHRGMGQVLEQFLADHPDALSGVPALTDRLRPTYLRAVVSGWNMAWKNGLPLEWPPVMAVLEGILAHDQASAIAAEGDTFDDDPDFKNAKEGAIRLLVDLARPNPERQVPEATLTEVARLLLDSFGDQQAWADYATRGGSDGTDPLTLSLNWQWPIALRGLINLTAHGPTTPWSKDALAALERELQRDDKAGAGYAVLGEGFGLLYNGNLEWLASHIDTLFGSETGLTRSQEIALTTTLATHHVHSKILELLRSPLLAALQSPNPLAVGWKDDTGGQELIGRWIVTCIVWNAITSADPLATTFFACTPPAVRGSVIGHIAWSFMHTDHVDPENRVRLENLWDHRVSHVRHTPADSAELDDFFWFIQSNKFESSWWVPRLREAAELDSTLSTRGMIGEQLAAAAPHHPHDVLYALRALIDRKDESGMQQWDLQERAAPAAIAAALDSTDATLKKDANDLMNKLGGGGMTDLKERIDKLRGL